MSSLPSPSDEEMASTKRWNYFGGGLIVIAVFGPRIATKAGLGDFSADDDYLRTLISLALLSFIAWLVVRKQSELAKARANAVVGVLLCATVVSNIVHSAAEEELAREFHQQLLAFRAQHESRFVNLGRRFEEITVTQYLTPEGLASSANIAAGNVALERYRSLLQERELLLRTYFADCEAFIARSPEGKFKEVAETSLKKDKEVIGDIYKMLDRTEREHADAMATILDWATVNNGNLAVSNGQLLFATVEQQQILQRLIKRLEAAEKQVETAAKQAQTALAAALEQKEQAQKTVGGLNAN